jgi:hypothetical protein
MIEGFRQEPREEWGVEYTGIPLFFFFFISVTHNIQYVQCSAC